MDTFIYSQATTSPVALKSDRLFAFLKTNLLNIMIIAVTAYFLLIRQLSFHVELGPIVFETIPDGVGQLTNDNSERNAVTSVQVTNVAPIIHEDKKERENIPFKDEIVPILKNTDVEKKRVPKEKVAGEKANTFANIAFILNPALSKRTDQILVEEKNQKCASYVSRFAPIAKVEQQKFGIPASITLAQGLLESDAGDSKLTRFNRNHFGIKCFSHRCKKGHCSNFTDDSHKDFFRIYQNNWESFRAHSQFLMNKRYNRLHILSNNDYRSWAFGLQQSGYATDKGYATKLIRIIETLKLYQYDI